MGSTSEKHCCENNPELNPVLKGLLAKHQNLYEKLQNLGLTNAKTLVELEQTRVKSTLNDLFNCNNVADLLKTSHVTPKCVTIPNVQTVKKNIGMHTKNEEKALYIVSVLLQKFLSGDRTKH